MGVRVTPWCKEASFYLWNRKMPHWAQASLVNWFVKPHSTILQVNQPSELFEDRPILDRDKLCKSYAQAVQDMFNTDMEPVSNLASRMGAEKFDLPSGWNMKVRTMACWRIRMHFRLEVYSLESSSRFRASHLHQCLLSLGSCSQGSKSAWNTLNLNLFTSGRHSSGSRHKVLQLKQLILDCLLQIAYKALCFIVHVSSSFKTGMTQIQSCRHIIEATRTESEYYDKLNLFSELSTSSRLKVKHVRSHSTDVCKHSIYEWPSEVQTPNSALSSCSKNPWGKGSDLHSPGQKRVWGPNSAWSSNHGQTFSIPFACPHNHIQIFLQSIHEPSLEKLACTSN